MNVVEFAMSRMEIGRFPSIRRWFVSQPDVQQLLFFVQKKGSPISQRDDGFAVLGRGTMRNSSSSNFFFRKEGPQTLQLC